MTTQNIPALPGFYVITPELDIAGTPYDVKREPIISWRCDHGWRSVPITMGGPQENCAVLRPDGTVRTNVGVFDDIPHWSRHKYSETRVNHWCEVQLKNAHPGFFILEGCLNDETDPSEYDGLRTPIIAWAHGADGRVYPVTQDGTQWNNSYVVNPDGSVRGCCEQSWDSVDEWAADLLATEIKTKALRAARKKAGSC